MLYVTEKMNDMLENPQGEQMYDTEMIFLKIMITFSAILPTINLKPAK